MIRQPPASRISPRYSINGRVIAAQPVQSIDAGEAALVSLIGQLTHEQTAAA